MLHSPGCGRTLVRAKRQGCGFFKKKFSPKEYCCQMSMTAEQPHQSMRDCIAPICVVSACSCLCHVARDQTGLLVAMRAQHVAQVKLKGSADTGGNGEINLKEFWAHES
eukprot:1694479-Amphidinium_carterae.1